MDEAAIRKVVDEQAEDEGLWFVPVTITEDILQRALRRLHAVIEDDRGTPIKPDKCFACDRPITEGYLVGCADEQDVGVGPECYSKIKKTGFAGYQPPKGGPRLYELQHAIELRRERAKR